MRPYTLKQIQTFLEVARQGSVSKAAERLFVTQPAVSMQIRQLEDAFGLPLVEPVGRNIRLTHAGEAFRTHAIAATSAGLARYWVAPSFTASTAVVMLA